MAFKARIGAANFPAANDTIYVYVAGTTDLITGLYDPDTNLPVDNPFVVPSHGWYALELPSSAYVDIWWEEGDSYIITNFDLHVSSDKDNPYSQYVLVGEEDDPVFTAWDKSTGITISKSQITDFVEPQSILQDGLNIKTVNGASVLGSGNLTVIATLPPEEDPVFTAWDKSTGITITESQIIDLSSYQEQLVSGVNIKTINGQSVLGSGDLVVDMEISETDPVFAAWNRTDGISISVSQIIDFVEPQELLIPFINIKNIDNQELIGGGDLTLSLDITETDPVFTAWNKSTGITITESQIIDLGNYQEELISGVNIKTINGQSVLGEGDLIVIPNETDPIFTAWDKSTGITITESQITDLGDYQEELISGINIKRLNGDSLLGSGDLIIIPNESDPYFTAWDKSTGIAITESQISDFGDYQDQLISGVNICTINDNLLLGEGNVEIGAISTQTGEDLVNGIDEYLGGNGWQNRTLGNRTNVVGGLLKTCMGNSVDDTWLECNGDVKIKNDYPLLYPMMVPYGGIIDGFDYSTSDVMLYAPDLTNLYLFIPNYIYTDFCKNVNIVKNENGEYVALVETRIYKKANYDSEFEYVFSYYGTQLNGNLYHINGMYFVLGNVGVNISEDLLNWSFTKISNRTTDMFYNLYYFEETNVLVATGKALKYYDTYYGMYRPSNAGYYSLDFGLTWTACSGLLGYNRYFAKMKWCSTINKLMAIDIWGGAEDSYKSLALTSNGTTWTTIAAFGYYNPIDFDWSDTLGLGVIFLKYSNTNFSLRVSTNGTTWIEVPIDLSLFDALKVTNVVWNEDLNKFFIFSNGGFYLYSDDGYNWIKVEEDIIFCHYWDTTQQKYITVNGEMTWGLDGFYLPDIPSIDREITYIKAK